MKTPGQFCVEINTLTCLQFSSTSVSVSPSAIATTRPATSAEPIVTPSWNLSQLSPSSAHARACAVPRRAQPPWHRWRRQGSEAPAPGPESSARTRSGCRRSASFEGETVGARCLNAKTCFRCEGRGKPGTNTCGRCNGSGVFQAERTVSCRRCGGTGEITVACKRCAGSGKYTRRR